MDSFFVKNNEENKEELSEVQESFGIPIEEKYVNEENKYEKDVEISEETKEILQIKEIKKEDISNIKINPRDELDKKLIDKLKELSSEDLEPINLGYTDKPLIINGVEIENKVFLIDGEHRYRSRDENSLIKCNIKYYKNELEIRRSAVIMNLHGQRLKESEIEKMVNFEFDEFYRSLLNDYSQKPNFSELNRRYYISRSTLRKIWYRYLLKVKLKGSSHERVYMVISNSIMDVLKDIAQLDPADIRDFFSTFNSIILNAKLGSEDELKELCQLYINKEVDDMESYARYKSNSLYEDPVISTDKEAEAFLDKVESDSIGNSITQTKEEINNLNNTLAVSSFNENIKSSIKSGKRFLKEVLEGNIEKNIILPEEEELNELEKALNSYLKMIKKIKEKSINEEKEEGNRNESNN